MERHDASDPRPDSSRRVAIIGAGPGGICTGVRLLEAGHTDFVILEKAPGIGGTWFHNRYPGAECDVKSHLYSFSFAPNPGWSRPYARQPEIKAYLEDCVERFGLAPYLRLGTEVHAARWDEDTSTWRLTVGDGEIVDADVVVSALGMFGAPIAPDIPGLDRFTGSVFHSARWDDDHDLTGEAVAVIGSAASAVQLVPEIAPLVGQLYLYQRSANWVLPKEDTPFTPEEIDALRADLDAVAAQRDTIFGTIDATITFSNPEILAGAEEAGLRNLAIVEDPEVRRKLTPDVPWGCQRPLSSNLYYPTFNRPNVELVVEPITEITGDSVVTADGRARRVDTIIPATGFATTKFLGALDVVGRDGVHITEAWADGPQAYLGITTSGFPNLFMLYGPNTNNGSIIYMIECQVEYVTQLLQRMDDEGLASIDVKREVMHEYNEALQGDLAGVDVWQAGCNGYYRVPSGRIVTQWPHTMSEYRARTRHPDPDAFDVVPAS
jgi:cation diffusion facilitator CzcD-associated flavoprotein CzcO